MAQPLQIRNSTAEFLIFQAEDKAQGVQVFYKEKMKRFGLHKRLSLRFLIKDVLPLPNILKTFLKAENCKQKWYVGNSDTPHNMAL